MRNQTKRGITPGLATNSGSFKAAERADSGVILSGSTTGSTFKEQSAGLESSRFGTTPEPAVGNSVFSGDISGTDTRWCAPSCTIQCKVPCNVPTASNQGESPEDEAVSSARTALHAAEDTYSAIKKARQQGTLGEKIRLRAQQKQAAERLVAAADQMEQITGHRPTVAVSVYDVRRGDKVRYDGDTFGPISLHPDGGPYEGTVIARANSTWSPGWLSVPFQDPAGRSHDITVDASHPRMSIIVPRKASRL